MSLSFITDLWTPRNVALVILIPPSKKVVPTRLDMITNVTVVALVVSNGRGAIEVYATLKSVVRYGQRTDGSALKSCSAAFCQFFFDVGQNFLEAVCKSLSPCLTVVVQRLQKLAINTQQYTALCHVMYRTGMLRPRGLCGLEAKLFGLGLVASGLGLIEVGLVASKFAAYMD